MRRASRIDYWSTPVSCVCQLIDSVSFCLCFSFVVFRVVSKKQVKISGITKQSCDISSQPYSQNGVNKCKCVNMLPVKANMYAISSDTHQLHDYDYVIIIIWLDKFETRKIMNATVLPYFQFGMNCQCFAAARFTWTVSRIRSRGGPWIVAGFLQDAATSYRLDSIVHTGQT